jgi:hypothetical protein
VGFGADQRDIAGEAFTAQGFGGCGAGQARTRNNN